MLYHVDLSRVPGGVTDGFPQAVQESFQVGHALSQFALARFQFVRPLNNPRFQAADALA